MIDGNIGGLEVDAVQGVSQAEDGVYAILKTEVGLEFLISKVVFCNALFLCVVAEIPRTDLVAVKAYGLGELIQFCNLLFGLGQGGGTQFLYEFPDCIAVLYHAALGLVVGKVLVTQQGGLLVAEIGYLADGLGVVPLIAECAAVVGAVYLLTQVTAVTELDESAVAGGR